MKLLKEGRVPIRKRGPRTGPGQAEAREPAQKTKEEPVDWEGGRESMPSWNRGRRCFGGESDHLC